MVSSSAAPSLFGSRRLLKKTFEATFSILDGALADLAPEILEARSAGLEPATF
jgi:hypothetical protein